MKISEVRVFLLERTLTSSMQISRGGFQRRTHLIVQIETDEGVTGLGEGVGSARTIFGILEADLARKALGLCPLDIETVRSCLIEDQVYFERGGSAVCAASALEMACWDIKGKALGVPVYQLLGGLYRDRIEAYASDVYWEADGARMAARADGIMQQGIRTVKAHVGREGPDEDGARLREVRRALGAEARLMVDLNAGYAYTEALRATRLWQDLDLVWLEEPLLQSQSRRYADLRKHTTIPVAAGENEFLTRGFKALFDSEAVDVAMPDIGRVGGLQEARNICVLAEAYGVQVSPHNFSSGVLLAATLHLMAAVPTTWLLELDTSENAIYQDFLIEPLDLAQGCVRVPSLPGLGVALDTEVLDKWCVARKTFAS